MKCPIYLQSYIGHACLILQSLHLLCNKGI